MAAARRRAELRVGRRGTAASGDRERESSGAKRGDGVTAAPAGYWRDLMRRHSIRPKKRLGQNFLIDPSALEKVLQAAELGGTEAVLEIGAGLGSLTCLLVQAARRVTAYEVDRSLEPALQEAVGTVSNLRVVWGDILKADWAAEVGEDRYAVVANIPYSITSVLLRRLLESERGPFRIVLTLQKEVVERILSGPGDMNLLALSVQAYGRPRLMERIPADSFFPPPDIDSAVLRVDVHPAPAIRPELLDPFFRAARAGFSQKRKQLKNALAAGLGVPVARATDWLKRAQVEPSRRAQELSLEEWARLASLLSEEESVRPEGLPEAVDRGDRAG